MQTVTLKNLTLGTGTPKIIVSLMAQDFDAVTQEAECYRTASGADFDILEWRVDFFRHVATTEEVLAAGLALREAFPETPLLFTFRSRHEGGEVELPLAQYRALLCAAAQSQLFDAIDLELFSGNTDEEVLLPVLATAREHNVLTVMSSHDFGKTPSEKEILSRLLRMEALGADIAKIALMPQKREDVLTLLSASIAYSERPSARPLITMSMGGIGVASRVIGELTGSCATFGALRRASAPGQMNISELRTVLTALHRAATGSTTS